MTVNRFRRRVAPVLCALVAAVVFSGATFPQTTSPSSAAEPEIDAGDVVIDGSVRGRLARLERALTQ